MIVAAPYLTSFPGVNTDNVPILQGVYRVLNRGFGGVCSWIRSMP